MPSIILYGCGISFNVSIATIILLHCEIRLECYATHVSSGSACITDCIDQNREQCSDDLNCGDCIEGYEEDASLDCVGKTFFLLGAK